MMQMKKWAISDNGMPENVYVLLRVFNMKEEEEEEEGAEVRGYIDPWSELENGNLKFEAHYTVTPHH
jgi:isopenicillin N synthase-like dioxygenase